jgi:tyrosyl-tRNA synthetase
MLCHGENAARLAADTARKTFEEGAVGDALPSTDIPFAELEAGIPAYELMRRLGLAASNGEARRLIKGGGGRLNDIPIAAEKALVTLADINPQGVAKLSAGKKRHALVRPV